jgi:hypothetical protein
MVQAAPRAALLPETGVNRTLRRRDGTDRPDGGAAIDPVIAWTTEPPTAAAGSHHHDLPTVPAIAV